MNLKQRWGKMGTASKIGVGLAGAGLVGLGAYGVSKLLKKKKGGHHRRRGANYWLNRYEALKWKKKYHKLRYSSR